MEWVETTGRTIAEAKEVALDQLGVDESDAEFEVVNDARLGLFGRLREEARVRARVRPATPRAKDANNQRRRRGHDDHPRRPRSENGRHDRSRANGSADSDTDTDTDSSDESSERQESSDGGPRRQSRNRSRSRSRKPASATTEGAASMEDSVDLSEQGQVAKQFLNGLLLEIGAGADIDVRVDEAEELVHLSVDADNLGHLIGPRGVTLHALQELTRTVVQRKTGARNGRIILDIAKYREKRRVALERFTRQVAEEVISSGAPKVLEPMNPADRKVVHDVVNTIDGVATASEGEEPRRRVVIKPAS